MPKYLKTNSTSKAGINYLRTIVESHNCIFQKIDQENDVGIDALIEIVNNEIPTGNFIATQIKSGKSYFDKKSNMCKFPIGSHRNYWSNYSLPVYGIVYIPEFESAYWIDIKQYLAENPSHTIISFEPTLANIINKTTFKTQFIPYITGSIPKIEYNLAKDFFKSSNRDEFYLGLYSLFKKYADKNEVWDLFIDFFKEHPTQDIPEQLVYYLSVIPWHSDMVFNNDSFTPKSREYGQTLINKFEVKEIIKLLHFIDEENLISRGTLGQSVEAIISSIPNFTSYLEIIIKEKKIDINIREYASIIYAYHKGKDSIPILELIDKKKSWYIPELIEHLKKYNEFDLYG